MSDPQKKALRRNAFGASAHVVIVSRDSELRDELSSIVSDDAVVLYSEPCPENLKSLRAAKVVCILADPDLVASVQACTASTYPVISVSRSTDLSAMRQMVRDFAP